MLTVVFPIFILATTGYCKPEVVIYNRCPFQIWPAIKGTGNPEGGGFTLKNEESRKFYVSDNFVGSIWARTWCDSSFNCKTGSCGNFEKCNGAYGKAPFSAAKISMNAAGSLKQDLYSISMIDGYNIPIFIEAYGGIDCKRAGGCTSDVNAICPSNMSVKNGPHTVGCMSARAASNSDRECCRGAFSTPDVCFRSDISEMFKKACPTAFSYQFDDATSSFSCQTTAAYVVQFC